MLVTFQAVYNPQIHQFIQIVIEPIMNQSSKSLLGSFSFNSKYDPDQQPIECIQFNNSLKSFAFSTIKNNHPIYTNDFPLLTLLILMKHILYHLLHPQINHHHHWRIGCIHYLRQQWSNLLHFTLNKTIETSKSRFSVVVIMHPLLSLFKSNNQNKENRWFCQIIKKVYYN